MPGLAHMIFAIIANILHVHIHVSFSLSRLHWCRCITIICYDYMVAAYIFSCMDSDTILFENC